jgi:glyoxylase-like metal-dependent hydrolase (beta-lactamase superfamily II)
MSLRVDIISIGALGRNLLWNESAPVRTAHTTCSLIRTGKRNILVDPGLPAVVLAARLSERTGLKADQITDVFLTHANPASVACLDLFDKAKWLISEAELDSIARIGEPTPSTELLRELAAHVAAAPDKVAPQVDIFPLPGYTVGTCGLLVSAALSTTLLTGPALGSLDHFLAGQVLPECIAVAQAKESLQEIYDIADVVIPGFDNVFSNPRQFGM